MSGEPKENVLTVNAVLNDPSASDWLKTALSEAMERDAVDAANDAQVLAVLLSNRANGLFTG